MADARTAQLITRIQNYPCIWNNRHPDYANRDCARKAYLTIARETGMNDVALKRKFKSLRTHYTALLHKRYRSMKSVTSTDDVAVPAWKYFQQLDFLRPCVSARKGKDNMDSSLHQTPDMSYLRYSPHEDSQSEVISENLDQSETDESGGIKTEEAGEVETAKSGDKSHKVKARPQMFVGKTYNLQGQVGPVQCDALSLMNHSGTASPQSISSSVLAQIGTCVIKTETKEPVGMPCVQPHFETVAKHRFLAPHKEKPTPAPRQNTLKNCTSITKKRKTSAMEEAVGALKTLAQNKNDKEEKKEKTDKDENYYFFQLLAKQFTQLPKHVQQTLRYEFFSRTHEELQKGSK